MTQLEHLKAGVIRISRTKTDLTIGGVCTCLLVLGVISSVAIFTCITQLVPGDSSFDKVRATPCRAIAWAATLEGCTLTACTATVATPVSHNVTLNTTDVKDKFDYIERALRLLIERSDDQETYKRELREFMQRAGEKIAENTEATKKSVQTHENAAEKAGNATAEAKDRLLSYTMGTFFSVMTVSAGAYSKSANIFDVARVLLPYTICHFGVLHLSKWLEFGVAVSCLCIFAVAGTWLYHSDKGQEQITITTDTAHAQRPTHYVAPPPYYPPYYPTSPVPTSIPTPRVLLGASEPTHAPAQEDESNATPPGGAVQDASACMQRMARRAASSAHSA